MLRAIIFCCSLILVSSAVIPAGELSKNPPTRVSKWKAEAKDFSVELVQVGPDYARAVFYARGLPEDVVEDVSRYCIFGTIVKNLSKFPISYHLSDWRVVTGDGVEHKMKLKSEWIKEWSAKGVGFRWLMLADTQTFDEGDWIQGFTTVALPPGREFNLHYSWSSQGQTYHHEIKGIQCAPVKPTSP